MQKIKYALTNSPHRIWADRVLTLWCQWRALVLFIAIMVVFRSAIADWNQVPTGSMRPTILPGDRVVVNKLAYDLRIPFTKTHVMRWSEPERGDIVTLFSPEDEKLLIKRIIGTPGDSIAMTDNRLLINGVAVTYTAPARTPTHNQEASMLLEHLDAGAHAILVEPHAPTFVRSFPSVVMPPHQYLVLGDNRDRSKDSRYIGLIDRDRITGRAHTIAFSVDYEDFYLPRTDRFIRPLQ